MNSHSYAWRSVRNAVLVHLPMEGGDRLLERVLQKCLVVLMAVMMRGGAGTPLRGSLPDILQAAVEQGEYILHGLRIVPIVGTAAGHIDRRANRHNASPSCR